MRRLFVAALLSLALPAVAGAQVTNCVAPPGTAAIEEYCEQVSPPGHGHGPKTGDGTGSVDRRDVASLQRTTAGAALLRSVGPLRVRHKPRHQAAGRPALAAPPPGAIGGTFAAVARAVTLGGGLVLALLVILGAMTAWFLSSRRSATDA